MTIPPRDPDATRSEEAARLRAILADVAPERLREERDRARVAAVLAAELLRMAIQVRRRRRWWQR
jgi:hypothetical protein